LQILRVCNLLQLPKVQLHAKLQRTDLVHLFEWTFDLKRTSTNPYLNPNPNPNPNPNLKSFFGH